MKIFNYSPHLLLYLRMLLGPVLLYGFFHQWSGFSYFTILLIATLTDIFDGIIARRLGIATEWLRRADSIVDTVFFIFMFIVLYLGYPETWQRFSIGLYIIFGLEMFRMVFDHIKFNKQASYHMWSAKLWGLTLLFGFSEVFLSGKGGLFFLISLIMGIVTNLEGIWASLILPEWRHDVKSIIHIKRSL